MNGFWYHPLGKEGVWSTHTGMVEQRELGYPGLEPFEQFGTALDLPMKGNGHHDTHIRQWPKVRAKPNLTETPNARERSALSQGTGKQNVCYFL